MCKKSPFPLVLPPASEIRAKSRHHGGTFMVLNMSKLSMTNLDNGQFSPLNPSLTYQMRSGQSSAKNPTQYDSTAMSDNGIGHSGDNNIKTRVRKLA
jgi:hypothetical protein